VIPADSFPYFTARKPATTAPEAKRPRLDAEWR